MKKKPKDAIAPAAYTTDYKMLFEKATEAIDSLGKRLSLARRGAEVTRHRIAAYHSGLVARGALTDEDRRCCTLLDGILFPVMAGVSGDLVLMEAPK